MEGSSGSQQPIVSAGLSVVLDAVLEDLRNPHQITHRQIDRLAQRIYVLAPRC